MPRRLPQQPARDQEIIPEREERVHQHDLDILFEPLILEPIVEHERLGAQLIDGPAAVGQDEDVVAGAAVGGHRRDEVFQVVHATHQFGQAAQRERLPAGEYYHHELIGLTALQENGAILGQAR